MQIVTTLSDRCKISPFEVLNQNFDDFALLVNYFLNETEEEQPKETAQTGKEKRVKVNDKTASGGWF